MSRESEYSNRPTANALFPEVQAAVRFNPFSFSRIIVFTQLDNQDYINQRVMSYDLKKIGENDFFILYLNPNSLGSVPAQRPKVAFSLVFAIAAVYLFVFWRGERLFFLIRKVFLSS